jgi:hypothetical protein
MKYSLRFAALAFVAIEISALPSKMFDLSMNEKERRAIAGVVASIEA